MFVRSGRPNIEIVEKIMEIVESVHHVCLGAKHCNKNSLEPEMNMARFKKWPYGAQLTLNNLMDRIST